VALECERWQWRELIASEHGPANPSTRLVLLVLALHMNQDGANAFPSQQLIATRSGLSVRSVRTHLALAAAAQWVRIYQKRRSGQNWFIHEYVATIPDELADRCKSKPWEDDPTSQRAENSAGRSDSEQRHPANSARRAAIDDTTSGNLRHNARQPLPPNLKSNYSINSSGNVPEPFKNGSAKSKEPDPEAEKKALEEKQRKVVEERANRINRIEAGLKAFPDYADADIAKVTGTTLDEVQQLRICA